jgi:hypothetical protein
VCFVPEDEGDVLLRNTGLTFNELHKAVSLTELQVLHDFEIAGNVKFMKNCKTKFCRKKSWKGSTQVHDLAVVYIVLLLRTLNTNFAS